MANVDVFAEHVAGTVQLPDGDTSRFVPIPKIVYFNLLSRHSEFKDAIIVDGGQSNPRYQIVGREETKKPAVHRGSRERAKLDHVYG
ncbi:unnamed protein product [marine sediment metagenome]|uniref:Uncharacterized protein n=1 Tax=marine sediment metagenome TaxID=412755 RepID=X0W9X1_9ZZZZ